MTLVDALSEAPRGLVECHCVGAEAELARRWGGGSIKVNLPSARRRHATSELGLKMN